MKVLVRDMVVGLLFVLLGITVQSKEAYFPPTDGENTIDNNSASTANSGRCIAFANYSDRFDVKITVLAYSSTESKRFLVRQLKAAKSKLSRDKKGLVEHVYSIPRGQIISLNQKPLRNIRGKPEYFAGIEVAAQDVDSGATLLPRLLPAEQLDKINTFLHAALDDQRACVESGLDKQATAAVMIVDADGNPELAAIPDENIALFGNGLALVTPVMDAKSALQRMKIHAKHHPRTMEALKSTAKIGSGVGSLALGNIFALKKMGEGVAGVGQLALGKKGEEFLQKNPKAANLIKKLQGVSALTEALLEQSPTDVLSALVKLQEDTPANPDAVIERIRKQQEVMLKILEALNQGEDAAEYFDDFKLLENDTVDAKKNLGLNGQANSEVLQSMLDMQLALIGQLRNLIFKRAMQGI